MHYAAITLTFVFAGYYIFSCDSTHPFDARFISMVGKGGCAVIEGIM